eukprot:TRINITY_DN20540_c0_g1_i1.p2 TRINITY_DN20540_c0_g1~~TRINITY_DN20540_c0_g1_i1.p2  ORF type:complete len:100 (+),score=25.43 TRINITY_DN20540_c0_g1_i1:64-363(+)
MCIRDRSTWDWLRFRDVQENREFKDIEKRKQHDELLRSNIDRSKKWEAMNKRKYFLKSMANDDETIEDKKNLSSLVQSCLLYTSPSPRDGLLSRMPSSA